MLGLSNIERADHERERQRDDGERHPSGPDRGEGDEHADRRCSHDPDQQGDQERYVEAAGGSSGGPRPETSQRVLAERQLAGVAGHDDHRRDDDADAEGGHQGVGVARRGEDQHGTDDDREHQRHPGDAAAAGQRQPGVRLTAGRAGTARRHGDHEDDQQWHGLRQPCQRLGADVPRVGDVRLEQRELALQHSDDQRCADRDPEQGEASDQRRREGGQAR